MLLSEFAARTRLALRDADQEHFEDEEISRLLDDFIRENYYKIVKQHPRYYFKREDYTGIVDATDSDNELYLLPDDFYAVGNVRRSDLTDKPKLKYVGDHLDIQKYRYNFQFPFFDPDPSIPYSIYETWTLYDETQWRILPEPKGTNYTYWFNYYRKWVEAIQDGDTVDVPDQALTFCIGGVAKDFLIFSDDPAKNSIIPRLDERMASFFGSQEQVQSGTLPNVEQWW